MNIGSSALIGSWKTIAISAPRMERICECESVVRSRPPYMIEPPVTCSGGLACSANTDSAVSDLPQPLSPTTARISFG